MPSDHTAERRYRFAGSETSETTPPPTTNAVDIVAPRRIVPATSRDAGAVADVAADDVVRVELENGFVLWSRADDLLHERGQALSQRDGETIWTVDFGVRPGRAPAGGERGLLKLAVRVLDVFGIKLKEKAAVKLGAALEDRKLGHAPGLYRCAIGRAIDGEPPLQPIDAPIVTAGPLLVFLHGTGSSASGSFGALWADDNAAGGSLRKQLAARYGERVFAFEHRTLTESPVINALALARALPDGAELHLVSHSRGGMVGELMCLGMRDASADPLTPALIDTLFAADRTVAEQLGLSLEDAEAKKRDAAYDADRKALGELLAVLRDKCIRVSRFVRVACPARGTTLASGRLDRWLSMVDFISGNGLFGDAVDFLVAVVKERTDPRTLPGLEAMMPGSALTRLLQHPDLEVSADLSVIAGDVEGDSLWSQIKLLAADWFYGADHDLVVNTGSMLGGLRRPAGGARFLRDDGAQVTHFKYFANEKSVRWLGAGLMRAEGADGGFQPIETAPHEAPRWREALRRSRDAGEPRPLAVVLPGTMGSVLQQQGETVWIDYWRLLRGQLRRLRMGTRDVEPVDLIGDFYGPMIEFLAATHRVEIFPYDWRLSVREAAARLTGALERWLPAAERDNQPVHLVAHSMGGLVVRTMISDAGAGSAVWRRICALPDSRFVMLGTPNLGSHEAVRWLTAQNPTQLKLALLDITQNTIDVLDIVRDYPGLLELLPFAPDGRDFADAELWTRLKAELEAVWPTATAERLRDARNTWQRLLEAPPDASRMIYLAGHQPATVVDYRVESQDAFLHFERRKLVFDATAQGDGTVTWASGRLPGVPTWYVEDTPHDALCAQHRAFPGLLELLNTGTTELLPAAPPRARAGVPDRFPMPEQPFTDDLPDADALHGGLGLGGGLPPGWGEQGAGARPIKVTVRHGDLAYARHPVLVGHYAGDTIVSAEAALDKRLGEALSRRLQLGLYPAENGSHALFFNEAPHEKPAGAIVVGLGLVGELTPALLEAGVRDALLDYALRVAQWPAGDLRFGEGAPRKAAVSCLLVGSGAGGMPVSASVEAILRAAVAARDRLNEPTGEPADDGADERISARVLIDEIEFIEIYQDVAIQAAEGVRQALRDGTLAEAVSWPDHDIQTGQGRRRRVRTDEAPEWWHRLEIIEEENRCALRFIFATDRARAEETLNAGQLELADAFIERASASPAANSEVAKTLYEMLLPNRLKALAPRQSHMVLMVDAASARYPWELLEDRWRGDDKPPAVCAGLVRQFKTRRYRAQPAHSPKLTAFVVGNPDLSGWDVFPDLDGARKEATAVAELLRKRGFDAVHECIDAPEDAVLAGLHRDSWRVLHLAGHGEHEFVLHAEHPNETVSGMVIGKGAFLTPGDVRQMRWVPELVFINCCHLAKTQVRDRSKSNLLAANLALEFVEMGVKAVVAAGWAVDDAAAKAFATSFYTRMLDGETFGAAVRGAREAVWNSYRGINTWGAYQCYGDPSYRLRGQGAAPLRAPDIPFYAPVELVVELENHAENVRMEMRRKGDEAETLHAMREKIGEIVRRAPEEMRDDWLRRADVAAALGFAWGETQDYAQAIEWLEKAMRFDGGDCPIRAVEQCANFRARLAGQTWYATCRNGAIDEDVRGALLTDIEASITELDLVCQRAPSAERYNLLGSACKRLAWVLDAAAPRREALINMANYYGLGMKAAADDVTRAYAFTNAETARLLVAMADAAARRRPAKGKQSAAQKQLAKAAAEAADAAAQTLDADCVAMIETLKLSNQQDPNLWKSVGEGDCELVRLLAARGSDVSERAERACRCYVAALKRGASPRERASVVEHLDFVIAMSAKAGKPVRDALVKIREKL